jgi:hypothetical protein
VDRELVMAIKLQSDPRELQPNYGNPRKRKPRGEMLDDQLDIEVYKYSNHKGHWIEFRIDGKVLKTHHYTTQVERDLDLIRLKNDLIKTGGTVERVYGDVERIK